MFLFCELYQHALELSETSKNHLIKYASDDGNDTILGFFEDDILRITKGSYSAKAVDADVVVTVGKGSILLQGVGSTKISIMDSSGKIVTKSYSTSSNSDLFEENNFVSFDNLSEIT